MSEVIVITSGKGGVGNDDDFSEMWEPDLPCYRRKLF